ncbi:transmembrane protein 242 isoform X1 [Rhipicephalus sanguineus]|uniref:transmembrane protein 242 isoform X1 n=1 Tax=Rhipicephalus sanguineus TaxID=34632 RepID=UPI00189430E8|nr:transmembrane protein 242 isoform X1 [Rhipicephalus sanguineus]
MDQNSEPDGRTDDSTGSKRKKYAEAAFLAGVAGAAAIFGFGMTLAQAKKRDPENFAEGLTASQKLHESGSKLALRALGRGTLYSVTGFSLFCFLAWKAMGVSDLQEFRTKVGSVLPRIPKNEPQGRTEFSSLRDLLNYVIEESDKKKRT